MWRFVLAFALHTSFGRVRRPGMSVVPRSCSPLGRYPPCFVPLRHPIMLVNNTTSYSLIVRPPPFILTAISGTTFDWMSRSPWIVVRLCPCLATATLLIALCNTLSVASSYPFHNPHVAVTPSINGDESRASAQPLSQPLRTRPSSVPVPPMPTPQPSRPSLAEELKKNKKKKRKREDSSDIEPGALA